MTNWKSQRKTIAAALASQHPPKVFDLLLTISLRDASPTSAKTANQIVKNLFWRFRGQNGHILAAVKFERQQAAYVHRGGIARKPIGVIAHWLRGEIVGATSVQRRSVLEQVEALIELHDNEEHAAVARRLYATLIASGVDCGGVIIIARHAKRIARGMANVGKVEAAV